MSNQTGDDIEVVREDQEPFFSVIIATYNRSGIIGRALKSLVSQTEKDWEAIIIDDGSTDGTYESILPVLHTNPQINYRRIDHCGEATAKNTGIQLAEGKFITFLDSDDEYVSTHLKSRKSILDRHPSIQFLHGGVEVLGNQFVPDRFDPEKLVNLADCAIGGAFFIEREAFAALKGFNQILLGTDADLFERAKNAGMKIMEIQLPTYIYHHETLDSITNTYKTTVPKLEFD